MKQKDFFISYTSADRNWAEWIAWTLEEEVGSVILQAWDFTPGKNFILAMDDAAVRASRTIAVLSPDYLNSAFAASEWATAFSSDPKSALPSLIPVVVRSCDLQGLLRTIVNIDLTNLDESAARKRLVLGMSNTRAKPERAPAFPGLHQKATQPVPFPGKSSGHGDNRKDAGTFFIPRMPRAITDLDRVQFAKNAFNSIREYFEAATTKFGQQPGVYIEFSIISQRKFTVEVFVHGQSKAQCKIWQGGILGRDQISFFEGQLDGNDTAVNEALQIIDHDGDLMLSAMMSMGLGLGSEEVKLDPKCLSARDAGEYLWRRFMWRMR